MTRLNDLPQSETPLPSEVPCSPSTVSSNLASAGVASSKIRHEWYQNDQYVMISIFVKKAKKETVDVVFSESALSVTLPLPYGATFSLDVEPLLHQIVPDKSTFEVLSTKIEVRLYKKLMGLKWSALEGDDNLASSDIQSADRKPSYPTSSRNPKNWDRIEVEEEKPEGEQALNALFQTIYKDATDETRRAMMKSYVESNGTCLSTNWKEVGEKKVECTPPDGMEAKKVSVPGYCDRRSSVDVESALKPVWLIYHSA